MATSYTKMDPWGEEGYSMEFLVGVGLGSPNPDPISDQKNVIFPYPHPDLARLFESQLVPIIPD